MVTYHGGQECPVGPYPRYGAAGAVEGWVIDSYECSLLDGHDYSVQYFSAYNGKAVHIAAMPCRMTMLLNGKGGSEVFLKPVPKGPS